MSRIARQSTVTFASLITAAHFPISAGSAAVISAGVLSATGIPCCASRVAHRVLRQRCCDRAVEPLDRCGRRLGGSKQRRPGIGLDARHAALGECRNVRELGCTLCARDAERVQRAGLDLLIDEPGQRRDAHVDAAGEQLGQHRRQPLERHMQHVDAGFGLEQFAGKVRARTIAGRAERQAAGLGLRHRDDVSTLSAAKPLRTTRTCGMAAMPATGVKSFTAS